MEISGYEGAYPKTSLWKSNSNSSCCSWDGVECDEKTGHVIGLDLSSSFLYGSFSSNNTLFSLVHLERLNLADNDFIFSQIPPTIRNLPRLRYLNLSWSVFSGQVPSEISQLSKLSSLDLSYNIDEFWTEGLLNLREPVFRSLVQNLTTVQKLHLSLVNISTTIPQAMANLSFLSSLLLKECGLFSEFPVGVLKLQNLEILDLRYNQYVTGYLPQFHSSSPLISLKLGGTGFSGSLSSVEELVSLKELDVHECNFGGEIVPLANLTQLTYLALSDCNFTGGTMSWMGKHTKLTYLSLENINLSGYIPSCLRNLTQLSHLALSDNQLAGPIPSWIGNLSSLGYIDFSFNRLHGSIPDSIFNLIDLQLLYLEQNSLRGTVEILKLQSIRYLELSDNKLEALTESRNTNATFPNFRLLGLSACNIKQFPYFLGFQQNLFWLDLARNNLQGHIPKWVLNISTETMELINFSGNRLSGFDQPLPTVLPWINLKTLFFTSNKLRGPLPIPHPNILSYDISQNEISGKLPPSICTLKNLQLLSLENNKLRGTLPSCLGNLSDQLQILNLGNNYFHGILPQMYSTKRNLRMINVHGNKLLGVLPRSLANCVMLEFLDLSNNEFSDVFPYWMGELQELKLLAINNNAFYSPIRTPEKKLHLPFPNLRILDLSYNKFNGDFPPKYIFSGNSMRGIPLNQSIYMDASSIYHQGDQSNFSVDYTFSATLTTKGVNTYYSHIQEDFALIDLSSNRFEGEIPDFIGNLKGLRSLNISNNMLTGQIPTSLGNLTLLESLDLSKNKLSGEIPQQLTLIPFLGTFKVSNNSLTGVIPQGKQFNTFDSSSYEGNPGLCGDPLPTKCGNPQPPPSTEEEEEEGDSSSVFEVEWKFVLAGFASGMLVGVVLADVLITIKSTAPVIHYDCGESVRRTFMEGRQRPRKQNRRHMT